MNSTVVKQDHDILKLGRTHHLHSSLHKKAMGIVYAYISLVFTKFLILSKEVATFEGLM